MSLTLRMRRAIQLSISFIIVKHYVEDTFLFIASIFSSKEHVSDKLCHISLKQIQPFRLLLILFILSIQFLTLFQQHCKS